jgi:hypothetical protein
MSLACKARPTRDIEYADVFGCVVVINRHSRFNAGSASAWFPVFVDCCKIRNSRQFRRQIENLLKVVVPVIRFYELFGSLLMICLFCNEVSASPF